MIPSLGKLLVASSTPLSQSWWLCGLFVALDRDKCSMGEKVKWKYVQRMVTGAAVNAVAFLTTEGKTRLSKSSINNVFVCQSTTMSNQKQLHVSQSFPAPCGNCLGTFDKSPLSQAELKKALFLSVHVLLRCSQYLGSSSTKPACSGASWNPYLRAWQGFALNMLCFCKL